MLKTEELSARFTDPDSGMTYVYKHKVSHTFYNLANHQESLKFIDKNPPMWIVISEIKSKL